MIFFNHSVVEVTIVNVHDTIGDPVTFYTKTAGNDRLWGSEGSFYHDDFN